MSSRNEKIANAIEKGKVPVLPFELGIAQNSLAGLVRRQAELGKHLGEAMNQSSETWHDNAPAEAVTHEAKIVASVAQKNIAVINDNELFEYDEGNDETVTLGSIIDIKYIKGGYTAKLFLTGVTREAEGLFDDSDDVEFVTLSSPIGSAVIGKAAGDTAKVSINGRAIDIMIMSVEQYRGE